MFQITQGKGFRLTFANGWAVSVQWGPGNYCEHYSKQFDFELVNNTGLMVAESCYESCNAEIAVIDPNGEFVELDGGDVKGYVSADYVAGVIATVAAK